MLVATVLFIFRATFLHLGNGKKLKLLAPLEQKNVK